MKTIQDVYAMHVDSEDLSRFGSYIHEMCMEIDRNALAGLEASERVEEFVNERLLEARIAMACGPKFLGLAEVCLVVYGKVWQGLIITVQSKFIVI